jgi:nucleoredoxin
MSSSIVNLAGSRLQHGNAVVSTSDAIKGKLVAFYFSAHWCPPCKQFTPELARVYTALLAANKNIAVVFVSSDQDQGAFDGYFATQPWFAVPYTDGEQRDALSARFGVRGLPSLIVVNQEGVVVSRNARAEVMQLKERAFVLWENKRV